jgi:hypothetical protein
MISSYIYIQLGDEYCDHLLLLLLLGVLQFGINFVSRFMSTLARLPILLVSELLGGWISLQLAS